MQTTQGIGPSQPSVLVTGATGFVGNALLVRLQAASFEVVGTSRRGDEGQTSLLRVGELGPEVDWSAALTDRDVVIHAAARVHVMNDTSTNPLAEFREANVKGTLALARQAASVGVRRFIFISSIKVNGEDTLPGRPFTTEEAPQPSDPYGVSKWEAEEGLRDIAVATGMEVVVIRPPLVYGPGVKANFLSMMHWLHRGVPLPLGSIRNKRSLVALDNLVDLIVTCIEHPAAANQTFLVSDGEDLSTTELLQRMSVALGQPTRLLPVPPALLSAGAALLGKKAIAERLLGSLQVDISKTRSLLGWAPPVSVDEALRKTAADFLANRVR